MSNTKAFRRYLLYPTHALRGWLLLPHGVQRLDQTGCEFLSKHDYALLLDCDGQTDIAYNELPEADRARYDDWEKQAVIRRCEGEEAMLLPEQRYRYYNNATRTMCSDPSPANATIGAATASCPRLTRRQASRAGTS